MGRRSIKDRMQRAGSLALKREIALDWAATWQTDHEETLLAASRALAAGDMMLAGRLLGQIKVIMTKASTGMISVIEALSDDDAL